MKTQIKNLFLVPVLIVNLGLFLTGRVTAQTFTNLHSFTCVSDGANPYGGLILSGNTLYGTAYGCGSSGNGTVFKVNADGTGFTNLHSFTGGSGGANPRVRLILSGNTLYGTTQYGGDSDLGTVFKVNTDGTGFTNVYSFTGGDDGGVIESGLILSGNTLYGTAYNRGSFFDNGSVFKLNTDGTGITTLHSFTVLVSGTNSDGANPQAGLILSGNTLYGTALHGGSSGNGTLFAVNTNGTGFTNLHNFSGASEGSHPNGDLILSGNTLYGTAGNGGSSDNGTVFAVNTDGTGFTNLHNFTGVSDGANPNAGSILLGNTLYGTANGGGSSGNGTLFAVNTDGTGFTNLHNFTSVSDGGNPLAGLILLGNTLYGTTVNGGSSGAGTVFGLSLPPRILALNMFAGLTIFAPVGSTDQIQYVTDLNNTNWTTLTNLVLPSSPFIFIDYDSASQTRRFYRLIEQ